MDIGFAPETIALGHAICRLFSFSWRDDDRLTDIARTRGLGCNRVVGDVFLSDEIEREFASEPARPPARRKTSKARMLTETDCILLLRQAWFRERCKDHQPDDEIRAIVAETLAEQHRVQQESIDAFVLKAVASVLTSFGIEHDDRKELRADLQHVRRWRKSVEQAQSYTFKAVITVIATGLMGAVLLGVRVVLGK